ncbi:MAG: hypothetical protein PHG48_01970 [Eubacteriales bacterium]|nr:hypothetical protein [Eubacteriales bacterium]
MDIKRYERWKRIREKGFVSYLFTFWIVPLGLLAPVFAQTVDLYMNTTTISLANIRKLLNTFFYQKTLLLIGVCITISVVAGIINWKTREKLFIKAGEAMKAGNDLSK